MKSEIEKTELGFYAPSFMHMHVGTKSSLVDLNNIGDQTAESLYLHEYVHFLQDVTTAYGQANMSMVANYMRFVNNEVISKPKGFFTVPVEPIVGDGFNIDISLRLQDVYNGSGEAVDAELIGHGLVSETMQMPGMGQKSVETVAVTYKDKKNIVHQFEFGALCIMESMAYLVESTCYRYTRPVNDLPYRSAEKLVHLIHAPFAHNQLNIIALCDASLQMFHPGPYFYRMLLMMKQENIIFKTPEQVYAFCHKHEPMFEYYGQTTLNGVFQYTNNECLEQVQKYFNDPYFAPIADWLEHLVKTGYHFRTNNPLFILDLARGGSISKNNAFITAVNQLGTPLVTNDKGEATLSSPIIKGNFNYPLLWAMDQIHNTFWGETTSCELLALCKQSGIETDIRCTTAPWLRAEDQQPLCPYAIIWRHWKLAGYHPLA